MHHDFFRNNGSDLLYRAILMSEFKWKMLPRVELKLRTTVRISFLTEVLFPNFARRRFESNLG